MARLIQKGVLGVSLAGGVAVLLAGHQLYLIQSVVRGDSPHQPLIVPALVPRFESVLGKETMLAPQMVNVAWVAGGILAGVGFLGLLVIGLQESSQARKAARLVPPPKFDERDKVSSHDFVPEGLEGRARMIRFFAFVAFLPVLFAPILIRSAVIRGQPAIALVVAGVAAGFAALGLFVWRGDKNRFRKYGVDQIDVMIGGLRWVRHDDPTVRTVAWSQISRCESVGQYSGGGHPWNHYTMVTLRTGEKIQLPRCCLSDYDTCVKLVERGCKEGRIAPQYAGDAGLAAAFRFPSRMSGGSVRPAERR